MKTYRKAITKDGRQSDTHVIVDLDGKPYEVITEAKHPEKWAAYQLSLAEKAEAKKAKEPEEAKEDKEIKVSKKSKK
jgi:hypothetical protein